MHGMVKQPPLQEFPKRPPPLPGEIVTHNNGRGVKDVRDNFQNLKITRQIPEVASNVKLQRTLDSRSIDPRIDAEMFKQQLVDNVQSNKDRNESRKQMDLDEERRRHAIKMQKPYLNPDPLVIVIF